MRRTCAKSARRSKAAPLLLRETGIHADRRAKLTGGVGKPVHDRTERKVAGSIDVALLDTPARGRDETGGRDRLAPRFGVRAVPDRHPLLDSAALLRRQWRAGQVPVFVEPGPDLTVGRIDDTMTEMQPVIARFDTKRRALDMKAAAGAQFAHEADIEPPDQVAAPRQIAQTELVAEIRFRLFQPVEYRPW